MNLLTVKQVAAKLACSESMVWHLAKTDPLFPKSVKLGLLEARGRGTRWADDAIDGWIAAKLGKELPNERSADAGQARADVHRTAREESAA